MSERAAGILMPISSLPSEYGIGCFSKEAYEFVDTLKEQARVIGRFSRLDRPVMGILRISLFLHLQEIRTLSVLMN